MSVDDGGQGCRCVGDERVKVDPPDPVVAAFLDEALDHVEFEPHGTSCRVGFVVNVKVIAMLTSVV